MVRLGVVRITQDYLQPLRLSSLLGAGVFFEVIVKLKIDRETAHTTKHEMDFIDGLGTYSNSRVSKKNLINRYIASMRSRKTWGDVDKKLVFNHAMKKVLK